MFGMFNDRISGFSGVNIKNLKGEDGERAIRENEDMVILDVRSRMEYQYGHIPGAILMPVNEMSSRLGELEKYKGRPLFVYCASGGRSPMAVRFLLNNGFDNIFHLEYGISSWRGKIDR